jgi:hypothetical protein
MHVSIICGTEVLKLVGTKVLIFESSQHAARVSSLSGQYASRSSGAGGGVYEAAAVGQQERARSTKETDSPHTYDAVVIGIYSCACRGMQAGAWQGCLSMYTYSDVC